MVNNNIKVIDDLLLNYPRSIEFVNQVNFIFDNANMDINTRLDSLYYIGTYLYSKYKFNHAISILENLVSLVDSPSSSLDDKILRLKSYSLTYLGLAENVLGNYQQAIDYHNQSLKIAERIGDVDSESRCYTNLGIAAYALGNYQQAIDYHNQALEISQRIGDISGEGRCYSNLGAAARALGNYQQAIDYYNQALDIAQRIGDLSLEGACYGNLGAAADALGNYQQAIDYHNQALEISQELGM